MRQVAVVTTGFFDGVHLGHRHVLERLVSSARERGEEALVVTFWPHPRTVLQQDARDFRLLTSIEEKRELLLGCGVDRVEVLPFTRSFAALTAEEYLRLLHDRFGATLVVMGYDNRIGSDRRTAADLAGRFAPKAAHCSGTPHPSDAPAPPNVSCVPALLELVSVGPLPTDWDNGAPENLRFTGCFAGGGHVRCNERLSSASATSAPPVIPSEAKESISSTRIRQALLAGAVEPAAAMLGYRYQLHGVVVAGNRKGRTIGFPTANMQLYEPLKLVPGNGVYAVEVEVLGAQYRGMCNIGTRPTVGGTTRTIETNIFDFDEDIYGLPLRLRFIRRIRDERRFASLDNLRTQLERDRQACR